MSTSDCIAIIGLVATSSIGIWIGSTVQRNLTNNRALKEYFIGEIKVINEEYSSFLSCLFKDLMVARTTQEWFKIMNIKIETIQASIVNELDDVLPEVLACHITMKQFVTGTEEFNASYLHTTFVLTPTIRNRILEIHADLKNSFVKAIIEINKARKRN